MTIDQPVTTYSDSAALIRLISDYIFNIDPMDTPVVAKLGLSSAREKFKLDVTRNRGNTKVEILEDTYHPLSTTMANGTTVSTSTLSFTVTDASLFQDGFEILIDSEYMVVSAVNVTTNTITVDSRAYGGTNATHATGATINIVGMARKEGDDADYVGLTSLSNPYNYTAIFQKGIQVTGSENAIGQYGKPSGEYEYQKNKVVPELSRWVERMFFHGQRRIGTASQARSMGGIGTFVTSNSSSITTTLTKAALDAVAQAIYADGGVPDVLILPPGGAATLHNLMDSSSFVRVTPENTIFGMMPITRVNTQFFTDLQVLVSRHCPAKRAYMLDSSKVGFFDYRPFGEYEIARTGDSKKGEVLTELSLLVANGSLGHGYIVTTATAL
jgi:uncharacterized protein DUF5309